MDAWMHGLIVVFAFPSRLLFPVQVLADDVAAVRVSAAAATVHSWRGQVVGAHSAKLEGPVRA
jgi:hypothetical protein